MSACKKDYCEARVCVKPGSEIVPKLKPTLRRQGIAFVVLAVCAVPSRAAHTRAAAPTAAIAVAKMAFATAQVL